MTQQVWLPYNFFKAGEHFFVHLVDPSKINLSFGFLKDTIEAQKDPKAFKILPFKKWLDTPAVTDEKLNPVGHIFHVSRCGSTLLAQNLKASARFIVLGEPSFIGKIYHPDNIFPLPYKELASQAAKKSINDWNAWAHLQEKQLVVKHNSVCVKHLAQMQHDFSNSPFAFLIREPSAVLESLMRKPPTYIENKLWPDTFLDIPSDCNHTFDEITYHAGKCYYTAMHEISEGLQNQLTLSFICDYVNLAKQFAALAAFLSSGNVKIQNEHWNSTWSSKKGEWASKQYKKVSAAKVSEFATQNSHLLAPLQQQYAQLNKKILQYQQGVR
ncbi:hypothetical protein [Pseudoalteromonas phenolica]|uniref:hypothetical protein n=1 Tax=Pseudoalteromonas phenolica TaxID=161398 RepID=UPI00384E415A